ncbi:alpha/beta hydrolase family protein [Streptomyces sp. NPDC048644]|uniref:alpha/beta hydrolase family protein n=1 Tax=Streptomyces sp. NPDC048644 TaxID=3365582 RepID=UPI0037128F64
MGTGEGAGAGTAEGAEREARLAREQRSVRRSAAVGALVMAVSLIATSAGASAGAADGTPAGSSRPAAARTSAPSADSARPAPKSVRMHLPAPTGSHRVGVVSLHLTDHERRDPWVSGERRELMVSVRYPAGADAGRYPRAPQMLPGEAAGFDAMNAFSEYVPRGAVDWAATRTAAHQGAPPERSHGRLPVLLYSPGAGDPRSLGSTLCDELASRGYVVVSIDHTYEAAAVQFPGGRVARSVMPAEMARAQQAGRIPELLKKVTDVRVADTRFVLDELARADGPSAAGGGLPGGLRGALDLDAVGMLGHSAGGFTAALALHDDRRVKAAVNMDGVMGYTQEDDDPSHPSRVGTDGVARPLMLMGKDGDNRHTVASWGAAWEHSRGRHRGVMLEGGAHASYTDAESLIPQVAAALKLPGKDVAKMVGTVDPGRAVAAQKAYVSAFFDKWLRGRDDGGLLDGPSGCYPEMRFVP